MGQYPVSTALAERVRQILALSTQKVSKWREKRKSNLKHLPINRPMLTVLTMHAPPIGPLCPNCSTAAGLRTYLHVTTMGKANPWSHQFALISATCYLKHI
jgi:hypothetical protein